ncbi:MAG: hypothetical protein EOO20_22980 [Chryseobacterium sp.]|nr:MAG: hypothetical protein EOO20_22980 [Chryseobacterium sp.]
MESDKLELSDKMASNLSLSFNFISTHKLLDTSPDFEMKMFNYRSEKYNCDIPYFESNKPLSSCIDYSKFDPKKV